MAKSDLGPKLSLNGFANTGNNASIVGSSPGIDPATSINVPAKDFLDGNLTLMVPLLVAKQASAVDSSRAVASSTAADVREEQGQVRFAVTEAYLRVRLNRQLVETEETKVRATEELVRTTHALVDSGKGIEASVLRAEAERQKAIRALTSAQNDLSKSILDLDESIGLRLDTLLDPVDPLPDQGSPDTLAASIQNARQKRGLVQSLKSRLDSSVYDEKSIHAKRTPSVYGYAMTDATNRRDFGGLTVGLTISLPIFDSGRIDAEVAQQHAVRQKAEVQLKQAETAVEKEVRQAWLDVQTALANQQSAKSSLSSAQAAFEVAVLRVAAGKSIILEQLDALEFLTRSKGELAQAAYDLAVANAKLLRATGGSL